MKNCEIILIDNNRKIIPLDNEIIFREKEDIIFYHFKSYEFLIKIKKIEKIEKVILNVAGITYELNDCFEEQNEYVIFKSEKVRYFQCVWGYTNIMIKIYTYSEKKYYFYSKLLKVVLNENEIEAKEIEVSIKEMLRFIIDNNINLYFNTIEDINKINFFNKGFKTFYTELKQLEEIINCYSKNKNYFINDLKYKLINKYKVDDFEKVKTIDSNVLKFLIQNPQYYEKTEFLKGILLDKNRYYIPTKSLVNTKEFDFNIIENQAILGFLKTIYQYLELRMKYLKNMLLNNKKDEYYSLENIISFYYEFYYEQLLKMKPIIENMYYSYKKIMKCEEKKIENIPMFSYVFKNYYHYREIYTVIYNWFQDKSYNLDSNIELSNLITVDKIYEYYSLGKIIKGLLSLEYKNEKNYYFKYSTNYYFHTNEVNTFEFKKDLKKITLYYQPCIFTDKFENNIKLYRTQGRKNKIYTPDFILKIEIPNKEDKYILLDSKWQKLSTLKKFTIKDIIYKYCYSIETFDNSEYKNVILLQGREENNFNYIFQNSELSKKKNNLKNPLLEIIQLNPKFEKINYLLRKLEEN